MFYAVGLTDDRTWNPVCQSQEPICSIAVLKKAPPPFFQFLVGSTRFYEK